MLLNVEFVISELLIVKALNALDVSTALPPLLTFSTNPLTLMMLTVETYQILASIASSSSRILFEVPAALGTGKVVWS